MRPVRHSFAGSTPVPDDRRPLNVAIIPSVNGGLGHVTRTLRLARALERADPSLRITYVLSEAFMRPFNLEAVRRTGYPVRLLPDPNREERNARITATLGDIDVVIEDCERRLVAYKRILPRLAAWISIPMLPHWDQLFLEWPLFEQVDHILYALPRALPLVEELEPYRHKLTITGPIVDAATMPRRTEARRRLGIAEDVEYITHAPRGFPFGREFGLPVLDAVVGAFIRLREERPGLRLVLTAVPDIAAVQPPDLPPLDAIDGVTVEGILSPERVLDYLAGADLAIVEGSTTLIDAAITRTPVLMVPGTIYETWAEGTMIWEHDAGVVEWIERITRDTMLARMQEALDPTKAPGRVERLYDLIGGDGCERAVAAVLGVIEEKVRA